MLLAAYLCDPGVECWTIPEDVDIDPHQLAFIILYKAAYLL